VHAEAFRPELDKDRDLALAILISTDHLSGFVADDDDDFAAVLTTRRQRVIFRE